VRPGIHIDPQNPDWPQAINDLNLMAPPGTCIKDVVIVGHGGVGSSGPFTNPGFDSGGQKDFIDALKCKMCKGGNIRIRSCYAAADPTFLGNFAQHTGANVHGVTGQWAVLPWGDAYVGRPDGSVQKEDSIWDNLNWFLIQF
jgi:hypothetical protein